MNIGILGANGFLGRSLCAKYLNEKNNVFAFFHKNSSLIPRGCIKVSIHSVFKQKIDCLVVAIGGYNSTYQQFLEQYLFLADVIKKIGFNKIIFISSVEVYGKNENTISVDNCFNNPNTYGLSKIAQEFLIKSTENFIIIRPTYLFGTGMNENSLLPIWINKAKIEKEIIVYGDGKRKQDYLHIDDFSQLCWLTTINNISNNIVIAASGESITNAELAIEISQKFPDSIVKYKGEDKTNSYVFDVSGTQKLYDWSPKISIKDWLKKSI